MPTALMGGLEEITRIKKPGVKEKTVYLQKYICICVYIKPFPRSLPQLPFYFYPHLPL